MDKPQRQLLQTIPAKVNCGFVRTDYVCASPIAQNCGVQRTDDADQLAKCQKLGALLSERLGHPDGEANEQQRC